MYKSRNRNLQLRASIIHSIRSFFVSRGFLEVETPQRIPANAPEEHIEPIKSVEQYLHTSPELCMKRLLSRGHDKIFQICRCWRNGERGNRHVPEFTMLEWYRSHCDYRDLIKDCEDLLQVIAVACAPDNGIIYQGSRLELSKKSELITVKEAFLRYGEKSMEHAVADGTFDEIMVTLIEPALPKEIPVFLIEYPAEMAALARLKDGETSVAERFELYLGGLELANAFGELNSTTEQRERFEETNCKRWLAGSTTLPLPEPFLNDLASMPPSAGIAFGIDRLVMIFADAARIDEVIAFTPEEL